MDISGSHHFNASPEAVWKALYNPEALRRTLPNCREFSLVGEGRYKVKLVLGFAFLKAIYSGVVHLLNVEPPLSYTLTLSGNGPLGGAKGSGSFFLDPSEDGESTIVRYTGSVTVTGKVAALGQAVVKAGAQLAIVQFFNAMEREVRRAEIADAQRDAATGKLAAGF